MNSTLIVISYCKRIKFDGKKDIYVDILRLHPKKTPLKISQKKFKNPRPYLGGNNDPVFPLATILIWGQKKSETDITNNVIKIFFYAFVPNESNDEIDGQCRKKAKYNPECTYN